MKLKIKYTIPLAIVLVAGSCKKNLDINHDPDNPTSLPISKILPTVERNLGLALSMGPSWTNDYGNPSGGLGMQLETYVHRTTQRGTPPDQYTVSGTDFYMQAGWTDMYGLVLNNTERIIADGTAAGNMQYVGIAKIIKAYAFSQLVDVFGDIPFSEANRLDSSIRYPKFDDDATIYPKLIALLNEAITDLNNTTALNLNKPRTDDVIYGGNVARWIKAANTIKLKLYTQERKVKNVQAEVTALLSNPSGLISATNESFQLPFGPNGATDDRNPGFGDYYATQRSNHVSPWFYEILKGYNNNILKTNPDPRLPYYIFNQIRTTTVTADPTEYRDGAFVSLYFGSRGPNRDRNQQNVISLMGIYPVGGRYDDGAGGTAGATSGTGAAPYRFITYADRLYLEAELISAGVITGDARAVLQAAMTESFKQVDYVITTYVKPAQSVPTVNGTAAATTYVNKALTEYDAGSAAKKLELIMTEKWLQGYGSEVDAYTDYRRTGYPVLFDPNNPAMAPGGFVQPPVNGNPQVSPQPAVRVQLSRPYPNSLPWFQTELETNPNAPPQKDIINSFKVFWMP